MSDELEGLQRKALAATNSSDDLVTIEKAVSIARLIAETEKLRSEAEKLAIEKARQEAEIGSMRRESQFESARLWLPILVPLLSTLVLAGTLIFQVRQFTVTTEIQRAAAEENRRFQEKTAEDAQWREAIRTLADAKTPESTLAGVSFLRFFMRSQIYRTPAKELAFHYLLQARDHETFDSMFNAVMELPTWENFDDFVQIDRLIADKYDPVAIALKAPALNAPPKLDAKAEKDRTTLEAQRRQLADQITLISAQIAAILRTPRPSSRSLDLSKVSLYGNVVLRNVSFKGANIHNCVFMADVTGADFTQISDFEFSGWAYTAWWHAGRMDLALLKYLIAKYPFDEKGDYGLMTNATDYQTNINRLQSNAQSQ